MKATFSFFFLLTLLVYSNKTIAQQLTPQQQQSVNKLFKTNKIVYFNFKVRSLQEIPQFSKILSVDKAKGAQVYAHANKAQFTQFIRMNIKYTVTSGGGAKKKPSKTTTVKKSQVKK